MVLGGPSINYCRICTHVEGQPRATALPGTQRMPIAKSGVVLWRENKFDLFVHVVLCRFTSDVCLEFVVRYTWANQEDLSRTIKTLRRPNNVIHHPCVYNHSNPAKCFGSRRIVVDAHCDREQRKAVVSAQGTKEKDGVGVELLMPYEHLRLVVRTLGEREVRVQHWGEPQARISQVDGGSIWVNVWQFDGAVHPIACDVDDSITRLGDLATVRKNDSLQKKEGFSET